ncbi:hypothetical protein D7V88_39600 [Corallococcus terminator]|uniref:Uncharacterized protein n=1 Tax=Corallococcus terminator TaxID=2316733 RepID=A0A3A8HJ37_9BACT|nr:hypothetical protein D7V88_39600 [Corallococcus terminator]
MAAVALCTRCGGFLCGACTEVLEEAAYCEPCAERRWQDTRPWREGRGLLVANVLGLLFLSAPLVQLSWTLELGRLSGVEAMLMLLGWTLVAGGGGVAFSTWKLSRHTRERALRRWVGQARALRVLSALILLCLAFWVVIAVRVLVFRQGL